jgi:hypothetical protein
LNDTLCSSLTSQTTCPGGRSSFWIASCTEFAKAASATTLLGCISLVLLSMMLNSPSKENCAAFGGQEAERSEETSRGRGRRQRDSGKLQF